LQYEKYSEGDTYYIKDNIKMALAKVKEIELVSRKHENDTCNGESEKKVKVAKIPQNRNMIAKKK